MAKRGNDLNQVRDLLLNGLSDEGLLLMCFEVPAFRPLYDELAQGADKAEVVDRLVAHAARTKQVPALLALAKEFFPALYRRRTSCHSGTTRRLRPVRVKVGSTPPVRRVISSAQAQRRAAEHALSTDVLPRQEVVTQVQVTLDRQGDGFEEGPAQALKEEVAHLLGISAKAIRSVEVQAGKANVVVEMPVLRALLFLSRCQKDTDPQTSTEEAPSMENLLQRALAAAEAIGPEEARARVLAALAPYVTGAAREGLLATGRSIEDAWGRAVMLVALLPPLQGPLKKEVLGDLLAAAQAIEDAWGRARVLAALVPDLMAALDREQVVRDLLAAARAIEDERGRVWLLAALAGRLSGLPKGEFLAAASAMTSPKAQVYVRAGLAMPGSGGLREESVMEALDSVRVIDAAWAPENRPARLAAAAGGPKAEALVDLAIAVQLIEDKGVRAYLQARLAGQLAGAPEAIATEVLAAARAIDDDLWRGRVLTTLAPDLPADLRDAAVGEAVAAARASKDAAWQARLLTALAPLLPETAREEVQAEALVAARAIREPWVRAQVLGLLAFQLTGALKRDALAAVQAIGNGLTYADLLARFTDPPSTTEPGEMMHDARLVENQAALRSRDLSGLNLSRANLRRANLEGTNLRRTRLREADLREAGLARASLVEADLTAADLQGADLSKANLRNAIVRGEQLAQARSLEGATLPDGRVHE